MRRLLTVLAVATLTACAGGKKPVDTGAAPPPAASPTPAVAAVAVPTPAISQPVVAPPLLATIAGTVTYRLRIALTPEAVVQVELRDVTHAEGDMPLIAKQVIVKPGQVPVPFSLDYDPAAIQRGHLYAVSARIEDRGQLAFVTETPVPVLEAGAATPAEIVVGPVK